MAGKIKAVLPIYLVGVVWLLWALIWKLYLPLHYVWAALASVVVYYLARMLCARGGKHADADADEDADGE